jgi:hypothetical protein
VAQPRATTTDGVVYVPALLGLGTPHWDYGARGSLLGLTRGTDRSHVVRAVLEGIAHRGADLVEAAEADTGRDIEVLRVDGGMSRNPTFVQALADATGRPVEIAPVADATTMGAGFLAGLATGVWSDRSTTSPTVGDQRVASSRQRHPVGPLANGGGTPSNGRRAGYPTCRLWTSRGKARGDRFERITPSGYRSDRVRPRRRAAHHGPSRPSGRWGGGCCAVAVALRQWPRGCVAADPAPPKKPCTTGDVALLGEAQQLELTAVALYDVAIGVGGWSDTEAAAMVFMREAHEAYAQALSGLLGRAAPGVASEKLFEALRANFTGSPADMLESAAMLESSAVATHAEVLDGLEGIDGAKLVASIFINEARFSTVLADLAGKTDTSDLLVDTEEPSLVGQG